MKSYKLFHTKYKIEEEYMSQNPGPWWPYEPSKTTWIYRYELVVEQFVEVDGVKAGFQRELKDARLKKITGKFDGNQFDELTVCLITDDPVNNGKYSILDGQARFTATEVLGGMDYLPCKVRRADLPPLLFQERAAVYVALNTYRTQISALEALTARQMAEEPDAVRFVSLCWDYGLYFPRNALGSLNGHVVCTGIKTAEELYTKSPEAFEVALMCLRPWTKTQSLGKKIVRINVLKALVGLIETYSHFDIERMQRVFGNNSPSVLDQQVRELAAKFGLAPGGLEAMSFTLMARYNHGLKAKDRLGKVRVEL